MVDTKPDDGGPAFPHFVKGRAGGEDILRPKGGMPLRKWYAGHIASGLAESARKQIVADSGGNEEEARKSAERWALA